jgi:hypothetical protein
VRAPSGYAADDSMLAPGDHAGMAAYVATLKRNDPKHTVMISSWSVSQTQQYEGIADVIGQEDYPVRTRSSVASASSRGVAQLAALAQRQADRVGKSSAFILQPFTWGDNVEDGQAVRVCTPIDTQASRYAKLRYPTAAQQVARCNTVLAHAHPKLILWWSFQGTYGNPDPDSLSVYPSGSVAAARWAGLSAAVTRGCHPPRRPLPRPR